MRKSPLYLVVPSVINLFPHFARLGCDFNASPYMYCTTGNGPTQVPAPGSSIPEPTTTRAGSEFDRTLVRLVYAKSSKRCF